MIKHQSARRRIVLRTLVALSLTRAGLERARAVVKDVFLFVARSLPG